MKKEKKKVPYVPADICITATRTDNICSDSYGATTEELSEITDIEW